MCCGRPGGGARRRGAGLQAVGGTWGQPPLSKVLRDVTLQRFPLKSRRRRSKLPGPALSRSSPPAGASPQSQAGSKPRRLTGVRSACVPSPLPPSLWHHCWPPPCAGAGPPGWAASTHADRHTEDSVHSDPGLADHRLRRALRRVRQDTVSDHSHPGVQSRPCSGAEEQAWGAEGGPRTGEASGRL